MPLYEYECPACGTTFEQMRSYEDAHLTQCPQGHTGVRRIFTPAGIIFKGSGFYVTDHRRKSDGQDSAESKSADKQAAKA